MFVDTHLHISDTEGVSPDLYIENAKAVGVNKLIASFCEKEDILLSTEFVEKYECMYASVGYHPNIANEVVEEDFKILENLLVKNEKMVAIGEIGLDYYWNTDNKETQKYVFERQLSIAERLCLPVVVHSRNSIADVYDILKKYSVKGVIHCFSGSLEMARLFINLGYLLGIGGVVTFKNSKLYQVVENIALTSIVLETDSPYLSPEPNRGKVNQSSNIYHIAAKIANIKQIDIEKVADITSNNAHRLFDL